MFIGGMRKMEQKTEKKSHKPEIEILPVKPGVVAVDDWYPCWVTNDKGQQVLEWNEPEEDQIFRVVGKKSIWVDFGKMFPYVHKKSLDEFLIRYKDSYITKLVLIRHYINYFIKFYDPDKEFVMNYFYMKSVLDIEKGQGNYPRSMFIDNLYTTLITPSIYEKVKKMVEDNYRIDLSQTNTENIKYSESLEFTNTHAKLLLIASMIIKMIIPIILHYITVYKDKKEIHNLSMYYKPIFDMIEENENVNLYGKLFNSINVKVNLSETKNSVIWDKYEMEQEDSASYTEELLDKNIIVDNVFKYLFIKNIIAFNSVIIDTQLEFFVIKNLNVNYREISTDKDSEGLSSLDKLEMNTIKIDESLVILSKINIKKTIKAIKKEMNVEITKEEREFYSKFMRITPIGKTLLFYFYAKYFDGYRDLKSITKKQYIDLMILMKRALQIKGDIYLPQILSAGIDGRINARTIHNSKLIDKIVSSEVYSQILSQKYSALQGMEKSEIIISILSTLLNTQFLYCDYDMRNKLGQEINVDFDILSQEFLDFVNRI